MTRRPCWMRAGSIRAWPIPLAFAVALACAPPAVERSPCASLLRDVRSKKAASDVMGALELAEASTYASACRDDTHFELLCEGAHAAALLDAWDRALELCTRAARHGWSPWLGYESGTALVRLGREEEALDPLERCLSAAPGHVRALQRRAEALARLGRARAAVESWTAALARIEVAEDAELAAFATDRHTLLRESLMGRAHSLDALGQHAAAEEDRTRSALLAESRAR